MAKITDIANIIKGLKAFFPNYNPPDPGETAIMLMQILGDMPVETLQAAVVTLCAEGRQFAPSAGEIRQTALRLNAKAAGIPEAWQAFEEVCKMPADMTTRELIVEDGQNIILERKLKFSHPLVENTARLMGWPGSFPTDMPAADRSQFIKAYDAEFARVIGDAGRLKLVTEYIDKRRETMGSNALALTANVTKQLEARQ
jgi:hypothetical protein